MRDGEKIKGKRKEKRRDEGREEERKRDHTTQYIKDVEKPFGVGGGQDRSLLL